MVFCNIVSLRFIDINIGICYNYFEVKNMGYDGINYLPKNTSKTKLIEFIKMLGFRGQGNDYYFFKDEDYKYLFGVILKIEKAEDSLLVHTRNPIYCSDYDLKYQNYVMKQLKQYFGGYFYSDYGKNRYFPENIEKTTPAERGCYAAYFRLSNLFSHIRFLVNNYNEDENVAKMMEYLGSPSGTALLSNISTTYISSIIENYFRQLYVVLLKYSDKKERLIASVRVNNFDLFEVSESKLSIEEAVALAKSFQNINKINAYFMEIDKRIDIHGMLSKPYHRRKETLYETLDRILEHRHSLVHRMNIDIGYKKEDVLKDINSVEVALTKVYQHICCVFEWECRV